MKILLTLLIVLGLMGSPGRAAAPSNQVVRTAVIGGMIMTGLWPEVARRFEDATGIHVEVVAFGQRTEIAEFLRRGEVDLLTMHSGDITTDLVADGFGVNMRPWTRNELVIIGPADDPAGIAGMTNGAQALRVLAKRPASLVDVGDIGSREVLHNLWHAAGLRPQGDWMVKDDSPHRHQIIAFAREHHAYAIVGRIPFVFGKLQPGEGMRIMVQGDPAMRRPYIVMEANPERFPHANAEGARALSDYLLSPAVQDFLADFGRTNQDARPLFYPCR